MTVDALFVFTLGLGLLTSGCDSIRGYPKRVVSEKAELSMLLPYFTDNVLELYDGKPDEATKREYRDEVVNARLRAIDIEFDIFERSINAQKNASQIGTDWAVLGLSGAGAVASGAATKAILAAISGGVTGAKLSWDKTLYYEKTMPALIAQMEASRTEQLVNIRLGLAQSSTNYPLAQALVDVDNYYKAGTLPGAVIAVNNSAGAQTQQNKQALRNILLEGTYSWDQASAILRKFWKPDGKTINKTNQAKLNKWLQNNGYPDVPISAFLYLRQYAAARAKAVQGLGLGNLKGSTP